jgi:hypothetical protein
MTREECAPLKSCGTMLRNGTLPPQSRHPGLLCRRLRGPRSRIATHLGQSPRVRRSYLRCLLRECDRDKGPG